MDWINFRRDTNLYCRPVLCVPQLLWGWHLPGENQVKSGLWVVLRASLQSPGRTRSKWWWNEGQLQRSLCGHQVLSRPVLPCAVLSPVLLGQPWHRPTLQLFLHLSMGAALLWLRPAACGWGQEMKITFFSQFTHLPSKIMLVLMNPSFI